jgi:hypothetical protein
VTREKVAEKLLAADGAIGGSSPRQQRVSGNGREPSRREQEHSPTPTHQTHQDYTRSTWADARHSLTDARHPLTDTRHPSPSQADLRHVSPLNGAPFETSLRHHPDAEEYEGSNGGGEERRGAKEPSLSGGSAKLHLHIKHASLRGAPLPY